MIVENVFDPARPRERVGHGQLEQRLLLAAHRRRQRRADPGGAAAGDNGSCENAERLEVAFAIENGAEADEGAWVASPPKEAISWWPPGTAESGTARVTRPSAPVTPSPAEPPAPIVTVLPASGAPPEVSAAVTDGLSPKVPSAGGETSASDVAAGGVPPARR